MDALLLTMTLLYTQLMACQVFCVYICILCDCGLTRHSSGRGLSFGLFSSCLSSAPLNSGVGRVEERAKARRAAGSTALFGRGCAGRESIRLHHVLFWALVVVRGVSVCSSPPVFQPGVVQAVRPMVAPLGLGTGFRLGRPLSFLAR